MPPDMSPVDDEHHRLPDGTMLHIYVWMHRYGGQVPVGFVRQPQAAGWMSVYATPPNPCALQREISAMSQVAIRTLICVAAAIASLPRQTPLQRRSRRR